MYRQSASWPFERLEPIALLATDTWTGGAGNGLWSSANNWSAGVPISSSDVVISGNVTVTDSDRSTPIDGLSVGAGATLIINNNHYIAVQGNNSIADNGTIQLGDSSFGGELEPSSGSNAEISGTGDIVFENSSSTLITGVFTPLTIDSGVTIEGVGGNINGYYGLVNDGAIEANVSGGTFNLAPATFTNNGFVDAYGGNVLVNPTTSLTNFSSGTLTGGIWDAAIGGTLTPAR